MENKRILIIGGTGYIGQELVKRLIKEDYQLTLLLRDRNSTQKIPECCDYIIGNILDRDILLKNIANFDLVINLASVIRTFNKKKYADNVQGIKNLVSAIKERNNKAKLIYFSTQNVNLTRKGYYSKSKKLSEEEIINSPVDYLIIRPNYVYGIDKANDFYKLGTIISKTRLAPILGDGKYTLQPVLKDDLAQIVLKLIRDNNWNHIIEVSGKETLSMNQIISTIKHKKNTRALSIHIPISMLLPFKKIIPFDIENFMEGRESKKPYTDHKFTSFEKNIEMLLKL